MWFTRNLCLKTWLSHCQRKLSNNSYRNRYLEREIKRHFNYNLKIAFQKTLQNQLSFDRLTTKSINLKCPIPISFTFNKIQITNSMGKVHTLKEVDMIIQIFASKMWIFHIVRLYLNWNFFQSDIRIFVYQSWRSKALWCEVRELKIAVCNLYSRLLCLWEFDENLNSSFLWCVEKCVDL